MLIESKKKVTLMGWKGTKKSLALTEEGHKEALLALEHAVYAVATDKGLGLSIDGGPEQQGDALMGYVPPVQPGDLGDPKFGQRFGCSYPYLAGSMANGISSAAMVIALGKAGYLASFGAGGLEGSRIEAAILEIKKALPHGPFAFNLIHSPNEVALERGAVELFLKHQVRTIEASAYLDLTPYLVWYRVKGIKADKSGITVPNRVIAKVSRREVAERFLNPPAAKFLAGLLAEGLITAEEAKLAEQVPMCDALSVEADSGGHTDNRPLVNLLPSIITLRNEVQARRGYKEHILIGAGGGIGTPEAALAAFMMGAAYVLTGSVNQACVESGTSDLVRKLLAEASMADVIMAPASDMFEQGVKLQVLRRGTLFAMRAQKLYELYQAHGSLEELPEAERQKLESQFFKKNLEQVWQDCVEFFSRRDKNELERGLKDPKKKMALVFRWYLGQASHWAKAAAAGREMDYQIWTGPAMGAFNDWVRGTSLEATANRRVVTVAEELLKGACYLARVRSLELQGLRFGPAIGAYKPA